MCLVWTWVTKIFLSLHRIALLRFRL